MEHPTPADILQRLRAALDQKQVPGISDGQLLERFVQHGDESAFELLVWRHRRMVMGVCLRLLNDPHEAEDAFQATFLVLLRKAGSIRRGAALGSWLYRVAYRVALRARARAGRRAHQESSADLSAIADPSDPLREVQQRLDSPIVDEELQRLPEKYRAPAVLCYLEGKSCTEVARLLGWPRGTVATRLHRARELLRQRITGRGMVLPAGGLLVLLREASAAHTNQVVQGMVRAACAVVQGKAAGVVSHRVMMLTQGVLHNMFLSRLKLVTALLLGLMVVGSATGFLAWRTWSGGPQVVAGETRASAKPKDRKPGAGKPPTDRERLQGSWIALKAVGRGQPFPPKAFGSFLFTFKGNQVTVLAMGEERSGTYRLDPSTTPKQFDIKLEKTNDMGLGIYKLEGKRLTLSIADAKDRRPTSFKFQGKELQVVLRRATPKEVRDVKSGKIGGQFKAMVLHQQMKALKQQCKALRAMNAALQHRLRAQKEKVFCVLQKVNAKNNTISFTLRGTTWSLNNIPLANNVTLRLDGKKCSMNDLKKGMNAELKVQTIKNKSVVAQIQAATPRKGKKR